MAVIAESLNLADLLKYEEERLNYSRQDVTVAAGQHLGLGTVVGRHTLDAKIYALNPAAADGTQIALGVLIEPVVATLEDAPGLLIVRHAILAAPAVVWPADITPAQKATALQHLEARGILVYPGA
jgi:hypothetical protein